MERSADEAFERDPVIRFVDGKGATREGTLEELLSASESAGITTPNDVFALAWHDLMLRLRQQAETLE